MTFNVPDFILDSQVSAYRKMLKLLFSDLWGNAEAIDTLERQWPDLISEYKQEWAMASATFQREYKDPKGITAVGRTKEEKEVIRELKKKMKLKNDRMFQRVKNSKSQYEKLLKRKEIYDQMRTVHN